MRQRLGRPVTWAVLGTAALASIAAAWTTAPARTAADQGSAISVAPLPGQVQEPSLVFASYNVCKTNCAPPAPSWDDRRTRVARTIAEAGVDVIGLQEVTHQPTTNAKTQFLDLQQLLRPAGFVAPAYTSESDQCRWRADDPHPCTHTTGLLFRADAVEQVIMPDGSASAGTLPMGQVTAGMTADAAPRKVVWAYLQGRPGGVGDGIGPFLAIVVHTSTLRDPANEAARIAFG